MGSAMRILALDFETADTEPDSACALGAVLIENGRIVEEQFRLIRPPRARILFTPIHGIRWADVADQPAFGEVYQELAWLFEAADLLSAHWATFDRGVLRGGCAAYGWSAPDKPWLCTVKLARAAWDIRPTKLPDVCDYFGIALNHHDALSDALACAEIAIRALQDGHAIDIGILDTDHAPRMPRGIDRW